MGRIRHKQLVAYRLKEHSVATVLSIIHDGGHFLWGCIGFD
jgi:hypothetical protein